MGNCGEKTAKEMQISREEQDLYAYNSFIRAGKFSTSEYFGNEIAPVTIKGNPKRNKPDIIITTDECYNVDKPPSLESMAKLKPAFVHDGTGMYRFIPNPNPVILTLLS